MNNIDSMKNAKTASVVMPLSNGYSHTNQLYSALNMCIHTTMSSVRRNPTISFLKKNNLKHSLYLLGGVKTSFISLKARRSYQISVGLINTAKSPIARHTVLKPWADRRWAAGARNRRLLRIVRKSRSAYRLNRVLKYRIGLLHAASLEYLNYTIWINLIIERCK